MSGWLFQHIAQPPVDIWFLRAASHLHSYVPPERVADLAEVEESTGLLRQLAARYQATDSPYLHDLGRDLASLRHFLGLARARAKRGSYATGWSEPSNKRMQLPARLRTTARCS